METAGPVTVMAKVPLATARDESRTESWMLLKLPMVVGVPLIVMVLPLSAADSPGGRPVAVRLPVGAVPPRTGTTPLKPVWFTDQVFVESVPRVGLGLMIREYVPVYIAPIASSTDN